ncbi:MAG: hypothetical protein ACRD2X_10655 [Vicinamibacteraceae bacterium]
MEADSGLKRQATRRVLKAAEGAIAEISKRLPVGTNFEGHWSAKGGLQQTVRALRADPLYSVLYRYTSAISHVSDVGLHFERDPSTEDLVWQIAPRPQGLDAPSYISRELLWLLANRIDKGLGLGFAATLAQHRMTKSDLPQRVA